MNERTPRDLSTRDTTQRKKSWRPPNLLPDPKQDGQNRYKWIRAATLGQSDPTNVSKKIREGWELVPPDDPAALDVVQAADAKARFEGSVEVGGLVLARMPEEMAKERDEYYRGVADTQIESMDNSLMRENDPRMPLLKPVRTTEIKSTK